MAGQRALEVIIPMLEMLVLFAVTEFVLSLSPGPAVVLVLSRALRQGFQGGLHVALGIVSVNVIFFLLSLIGVGAALAASPQIFQALKYVGAAYLCWTAWEIIQDIRSKNTLPQLVRVESSRELPEPLSGFLAGVLTQSSSVKNLVIFLAIIPQFIDPTKDAAIQFVALCIISIAVELPILIGYALLAARLSRRVQNPGLRNGLDAAAACMLVGIAGLILVPDWSFV